MIKSDLGAIRDSMKNIMFRADDADAARLAMDHFGQVEQLPPVMQGDGLMAETDTEDRFVTCVFPQNIEHGRLFLRQSGPGRENDLIVVLHIGQMQFIRPYHIKANFAVITQKFNQVEGEGIVVIEQ